MKPFIIKYFIIPIIQDPEFVSELEFPLLNEHKEKLTVIIQTLKHLSNGTKFSNGSPYTGMNNFLDQNQAFIDKIVQYFISNDKKNQKSFLNNLAVGQIEIPTFLEKEEVEERKENFQEINELSPIVISTKDLAFLFSKLTENEIYKNKKEIIPKNIYLCVSYLFTSKIHFENEEHLLMNYEDLDVNNYIPPENHKEKKTEKKYILQQILLSIQSPLQFEKDLTFPECIEQLFMREKVCNNIVSSAVIQEFMKQIQEKDIYLFQEVKKDIDLRKDYIELLMDSNSKLLLEIEKNEWEISNLSRERTQIQNFFEFEHLRPFIEYVQKNYIKDIVTSIIQTPSIDEQDKRFKKTLDFMNQQVRNFYKKFSSEEYENFQSRIKKFLISKIYKYVYSPQKRDIELSKKIDMISNLKMEFFDIPQKYHNHGFSELAKNELIEIDLLISPESKLDKIIKSSTIIMDLMKLSGDSFPAIDDFLPLLIYHIVKSKIKNPIANYDYITRFMYKIYETDGNQIIYNSNKDYNGEYWLRHFEAAILFIEQMDEQFARKSLDLSQKKKEIHNLKKTLVDDIQNFVDQKEDEKREIEKEIERGQKEILLNQIKKEDIIPKKEEKPFDERDKSLGFDKKKVEELSKDEIGILLQEYKRLSERMKEFEFE